jgi:hypothetical protein
MASSTQELLPQAAASTAVDLFTICERLKVRALHTAPSNILTFSAVACELTCYALLATALSAAAHSSRGLGPLRRASARIRCRSHVPDGALNCLALDLHLLCT